MTPEQWTRLDELFASALRLPASDRERFAIEQTQGDEQLRHELVALLRQPVEAEGFLAEPMVSAAVFLRESDPLIGRELASYRLLERIGEGGMGVVYRARQSSPQRTVALKVIRPGAVTGSMLRRFQLEADTLARLQHPGIAQIFESGRGHTPLGLQPFFAMELVEGRPLLEYCREEDTSIRGRLELFAKVCDAVQHAHTKGVIHRDLKPGNILIDGQGQPKVLDFGIARLTDSDLRPTTIVTDVNQVIGTLPYMSPEQAAGRADDLDTRSDVYALGVVLYELLSGKLPYELRERSTPDALRIITEQDPTRLSSVSRTFRGDIETIVAKSLEKDRARRYQAAAELAQDIRRYLSDQAITARPASTLYQLRKFARRNRALVGGTLAAFILLIAGIAGTSVGMVRARASQRLAEERESRANTEARKATKAIDFLVGMLTSASPEETEGREVSVRDVLQAAAGRVSTELADQPEVRETIESAIGRTYEAIGRTAEAKEHLEQAESLAVSLHGAGSPEAGIALMSQASVAAHERRWVDAEQLSQRAVGLLDRPAQTSRAAEAFGLYGFSLAAQRKNDQAIPALRESIARFDQASLGDSEAATEAMQHLGVTLGRKGGTAELREGESLLKRAVDIRRVKAGASNPRYAVALNALASFYYTQSRSAEARPIYEESLAICTACYGQTDRRTLEIVSSLGRTYMQLGDMEKAEEFGLRAIEGFKATGQGETAEAAAAMSRLASLYARTKNYAAAEQYNRDALSLRRKLNHADIPASLSALAVILSRTGRDPEALEAIREAVQIERDRGFPRSDDAGYLGTLAGILVRLDRGQEAEPIYQEALAMARDRMPDHVQRASLEWEYATACLKLKRPQDAIEPARHAVAVYRKLANAPKLIESLGTLASALEFAGHAEQASAIRQELSTLNAATKAAEPNAGGGT